MKNMCRSLEVPNHQLFDALLLYVVMSFSIHLDPFGKSAEVG